MNKNLNNAVKMAIEQHGENILLSPTRLKAVLSDLLGNEDFNVKNAFQKAMLADVPKKMHRLQTASVAKRQQEMLEMAKNLQNVANVAPEHAVNVINAFAAALSFDELDESELEPKNPKTQLSPPLQDKPELPPIIPPKIGFPPSDDDENEPKNPKLTLPKSTLEPPAVQTPNVLTLEYVLERAEKVGISFEQIPEPAPQAALQVMLKSVEEREEFLDARNQALKGKT
ncbi:MAG: hypothetical protein FWG64_03000 [Firmicutes bacterium]|nr:hypothetical protein [Bacillota bacterium]